MPWAELLKRTWKIDVLHCEKCGGRLKLVAMVTDPGSIHRFLTGVGLPTGPPGTGPSTTAPTDPAAEPSSALEFSDGDSFATDPA